MRQAVTSRKPAVRKKKKKKVVFKCDVHLEMCIIVASGKTGKKKNAQASFGHTPHDRRCVSKIVKSANGIYTFITLEKMVYKNNKFASQRISLHAAGWLQPFVLPMLSAS